jgi:hypothetical protein
MSAADRGTGNNSKCNANSKSPANLEKTTEYWNANLFCYRIGCRKGELDKNSAPNSLGQLSKGDLTDTRNACNAREYVEEDTGGLAQHLSQDSRSMVLEVELALGDGLSRDNMACYMPLEGFRVADFDVASCLAAEIDGRHGFQFGYL